MARKAKKTDADDEASAEGEAPVKRSKKLIVVIGAAVVLLAGGVGGLLFFSGKPDEAKAAVKPTSFIDTREMTVNLARGSQQDRAQYLKLKIALEVSDSKLVAAIQPLMPRIEDAFQVYMRELRPSDLDGSAGVYRLKEELLRRVNMAVYPSKIDAVLFKEIVVQ